MDNLSKCPICGCKANWSGPKFFVWCEKCGFRCQDIDTEEEMLIIWNTLCRQIEVGKAVLAVVTQDERLTGEVYASCSGLIHVITEPIPVPDPDPIEVLERCQPIVADYYSGWANPRDLPDVIDATIAALKAERKER